MLQYITDTHDGLEEVLLGGCRWVQLRMKDAPDERIISEGLAVRDICRRYKATFILDDRVDLVEAVGADGVHLGLKDMAPDEARTILGDGKIIGATANTRSDIDRVLSLGADYIGLGPFRYTTTKKNLSPILGTEGYRRILADGVSVPVVAIGGITFDDLPEIMETGVTGVAISGFIKNASDPRAVTESVIGVVGA